MSHNQRDLFSTQRKHTERDPRSLFSGERLGPNSSTGLSQDSDSDAISMLVHSCRQRVNASQEIYAPKQNDRGQDLFSLGEAERYSQNINRHYDIGDGSASCLSNYGRTSAATSSNYYQPSISAERSMLAVPNEEDRNLGSIPFLPDGEPDMDRSSKPPQPNYTAETAADILLKFGLEHEDLEHLFSYPEDQVTPENLPFILQKIRIKKDKKASEANCSKPLREPAPDRDHAGGDNWRGSGLAQKVTSSPPHRSIKVIDYRHMDKYAGRIEENVQGRTKRAEDDSLLTIHDLDSNCGQDLAQQVVKGANSYSDQHTNLCSFFSSILTSASAKSSDPVRPAQSTKSHALKSSDFEQAQTVLKPMLKPQPQAPQPIIRRVPPSKPDLMVLGGDDTSRSCDPVKNLAPASDNKSKKQQMASQWQNIKKEQSQKEVYTQKPPKVKKTQQPPSNPQQPSQKHPPVPIPAKLQNPANKQPLLANPTFMQMEKQQVHHIPSLKSSQPYPFCIPGPSSNVAHDLKPVQEVVFPDLPTAVLMRDYAATTPKVFPHLCSLCNKECVHLKDWLTHQNTNFHLENCKVLRQQYPQWNGMVVNSSKDKPNNETPPSKVQNKKPHYGSRLSSRDVTPRRRRSRSSETRREKRPRRRNRSRSPKSSRYQRRSRSNSSRSRSRSYSSNSSKYRRSRSRSYERRRLRLSPAGHSSSRRSNENQSFAQRRSSSPRRHENWSLPQRRSSSPNRHENWSFTQRRSSSPSHHKNWSFTQRRSSSPSCLENRWSPKRSCERWSPAKRSHDAVATPQTSQELSTKEDRFAEKPTRTSVVQSMPKQIGWEAMFKTLAPALLAELAKINSTSSKERPAETSTAAFSSSIANKKPVVGKTSNQQKLASAKTKSVKTSGPTIVTLKGVLSSITYEDIVTAVEVYGKIKSIVLFPQKSQAIVCFERKADADKMRKECNIKIKGFLVSVREQKECVPSVHKHNPRRYDVPLNNSDMTLTIGERMCEFLLPDQIAVLGQELTSLHTEKFSESPRQLVISNLPVDQHSYCVQDIIQLFEPFGFDSSADKIYVLPQSRMAFIELMEIEGVVAAMNACKTNTPTLKDQKLGVRVLKGNIPMLTRLFYPWVMNWANFPVEKGCPRTISIKGITLSETASLREALRKIGGVKNFLPLHNKVFVEFESIYATDFLGVWYNLHKQCPAYQIYRLHDPRTYSFKRQMFPKEAMPDSAFARATVENCIFGIPGCTWGPFYLTMNTKPYLFLTVSPWFIIPEFLTIKNEDDIQEARRLDASPTIMLTKLPVKSFKHEDVAKFAWPYFSQRDLRSLYYNVVVLPLQRRAFVYFSDWDACCRFVRCHLQVRAFKVKGCQLALHFVLQPMCAQSTEENMYKSLMQLSNSRIGEVETLAERLLCVSIDSYQKGHIRDLLHLISSHGNVVNFLPLANRICIEMADSVGVARVLEESKHFPTIFPVDQPRSSEASSWKVMFESIDSLKLRLQDPTVFALNHNGNREYWSMEASSTAAPTAAPSIDSEQPKKKHMSESQEVVMVTVKDCKKTKCCPSLHDSDAALTVWKRMWKFLRPQRIAELRHTDLHNEMWAGKQRQLLISKLPVDQHSYCVEDIIELVKWFDFDSSVDMIYVLPESRMALVEVTRHKGVFAAFNPCKPEMVPLKDQGLEVRVLKEKVPMWPAHFYQWVMKWMKFPVKKKRSKIILIRDITVRETASLREALRKIGGVKHFLPLLDKVFVEFESDTSADHIGVWYNLHDQCPAYSIHRLGIPEGVLVAPQRFPNKAVPDLAFAGATVETCTFGIPELTSSPFYLTMRAKPFLFSTVNPWFIIPEFLTVEKESDINEARQLGASPTIMLTNLPEDYFKHEDVAKLAWPYFSQKDLRSLYYNVIVLPLQRRAFVHFSDWDACCRFVQCHLGVRTFRLNGRRLGLHFVLRPMHAQNTEENMYRSLMQLSSSRIGEVESLAQRLLCVEITLSHQGNIGLLLHLISRHAEVFNFLPLANRICIEMADSVGVARVLQECKHFSVSSSFSSTWKAIQRFENIESLNQRLQDSTDITLDLGEDGKDRSSEANPPAAGEPTVDPGTTAAPSVNSEQPTAGLMSETIKRMFQ
ncbi:uncharacterized protein LOC130927841 isoform X2 [Corythoichthys intestinalis]|uniref:uncharacterized protein LOC130927841 isoform X2 n=1 Tax=Corythoichthys intestinalis TaxID=161448 RepID=UPI0025A633CD|nr:uncharacterized protein LOC130927841 isoform X2 [Corythoichthys intestinalis]